MEHRHWSFIKSGLRLFGYVVLVGGHVQAGLLIIVVAELVGIWEEYVPR